MTSLVSFSHSPVTTQSKEEASVSTLLSLCVIGITEDSQGQSCLFAAFFMVDKSISDTIWLLCGANVIQLDIYSVYMNIMLQE